MGADFRRATVATATREKKLLIDTAPPWEKVDPPYDTKLAFVQKITPVVRKINRNCYHRSCTF